MNVDVYLWTLLYYDHADSFRSFNSVRNKQAPVLVQWLILKKVLRGFSRSKRIIFMHSNNIFIVQMGKYRQFGILFQMVIRPWAVSQFPHSTSATASLSPPFIHMLEMTHRVAGWNHNRYPDDVGFSISNCNCTYSGKETACRPRFYEIGKSIKDA